uniref:Uncharacterized protein n=1 Tax=Bombyx mori TaxID=7091 RepID=A0A8R2HR11_BOMMO|nr:uncharacterized protein LOC101744131 [Bombyx mori]
MNGTLLCTLCILILSARCPISSRLLNIIFVNTRFDTNFMTGVRFTGRNTTLYSKDEDRPSSGENSEENKENVNNKEIPADLPTVITPRDQESV